MTISEDVRGAPEVGVGLVVDEADVGDKGVDHLEGVGVVGGDVDKIMVCTTTTRLLVGSP